MAASARIVCNVRNCTCHSARVDVLGLVRSLRLLQLVKRGGSTAQGACDALLEQAPSFGGAA